MRVLVGIPNFEGWVRIEVANALSALDHAGCDVDVEYLKGYDAAGARTVLARKARDGRYDKLFYVDSDVVLPPDALKNLLESKVAITVGVYPRKSDPSMSVLYRLSGHGMRAEDCIPMSEMEEPRTFPVKGGGLGCALVDVSVFDKMGFPWFVFSEREDGTSQSEDVYFFEKAYWAGFDCNCDTRVRCGHICTRQLT